MNKQSYVQSLPVLPQLADFFGLAAGKQGDQKPGEHIKDLRP